ELVPRAVGERDGLTERDEEIIARREELGDVARGVPGGTEARERDVLHVEGLEERERLGDVPYVLARDDDASDDRDLRRAKSLDADDGLVEVTFAADVLVVEI